MWKDIDMGRSRFNDLVSIAEDHDGLLTAELARQSGFTDSVLARLVQRGRIERASRGVYRLPNFRPVSFHNIAKQYFGQRPTGAPGRWPFLMSPP
jgi:hypothetical protein